VALAVGLQAAATGGVAGMAETSVRALAKVVQVMPARLRRRVDAVSAMTVPGAWRAPGTGATVDPGVLTAAALACRDGERLEFGYTAAAGQRSDRSVEPYRLVAQGRRWYLVGYDLTRADWRIFRLDRLDRPRGTGVRFGPRYFPAADAATFVRDSMAEAPRQPVEVVMAAPADVVRRRVGRWVSVEDAGEERCRVRMDADDLSWAATALGVAGAEFTVVSPPELRDHLRALAVRFGAAADSVVPPA
jgi:predicted DNA-binding transcriptional regulator YafY